MNLASHVVEAQEFMINTAYGEIIDERRLVALISHSNSCHVDVVQVNEIPEKYRKHFRLDLKKGIWGYRIVGGISEGHLNVPVGQSSYSVRRWERDGVVGVYDRDNTKHLERLANEAIMLVKAPLDD